MTKSSYNSKETEIESDLRSLAGPQRQEIENIELEQNKGESGQPQNSPPEYDSDKILGDFSHKLLKREQEIEIVRQMRDSLAQYQNAMTQIGLATLRLAQIGYQNTNVKNGYEVLLLEFQEHERVAKNSGRVFPKIHDIVSANRALLVNSLDSRVQKKVDQNTRKSQELLLPWGPTAHSLDERLEGDEYYAGLEEYASRLVNWDSMLKSHKISREEYAQLRLRVAQETCVVPEFLHELLQDAKRYRGGFYDNLEYALKHNLKLVFSIANKFRDRLPGTFLDFKDMFTVGCKGAQVGIEKFDPDRGYKMSTYITWWIRQSIDRHIMDCRRGIRIPVWNVGNLSTINQAIKMIQQEEGDERMPSTAEIESATGISESKVKYLLDASNRVLSLDSNVLGCEDGQLYNTIEDNSQGEVSVGAHNASLKERIIIALDTLTPKERNVLTQRFGLDGKGIRTLEQVRKKYKVTRERIRQIHNIALQKLRHPARLQILGLSTEDLR